jgi:hypothetical protein
MPTNLLDAAGSCQPRTQHHTAKVAVSHENSLIARHDAYSSGSHHRLLPAGVISQQQQQQLQLAAASWCLQQALAPDSLADRFKQAPESPIALTHHHSAVTVNVRVPACHLDIYPWHTHPKDSTALLHSGHHSSRCMLDCGWGEFSAHALSLLRLPALRGHRQCACMPTHWLPASCQRHHY